MEIKEIFEDFAKAFERKIDFDYKITLQYEIIDLEKDNIWQIDVKNGKVTKAKVYISNDNDELLDILYLGVRRP